MSSMRPKPRRERVRLEALRLDPRLQLRTLPDGATFHEDHVKKLLEIHESGVQFDALEVVEEDCGKNRQKALWVIDGFNRHEMFRRAGVASVEVVIYPGTFKDAELWALASNAREYLPRTPEDCRRAFDRLLSSAGMLDRVIADRSKFQGTERALAAACGLSHGAVGKYLKERNLRVDRLSGKLIPADGPVSPERDARQALVDELTAAGKSQKAIAADLGVDAVTVRKDQRRTRTTATVSNLARAGENSDPEPAPEPTVPAPSVETAPAPVPSEPEASGKLPEALPAPAPLAPVSPRKAAAVARVLENPLGSAEMTLEALQKDLASAAKKIEELLKGAAKDRLLRVAKANGAAFEYAEVDALPLIPRAGDPKKKTVVSWPPFQTVQTVFAQLTADLAFADLDNLEEEFSRRRGC